MELFLTRCRSLVVDHLNDSFATPKVGLAYFYFSYQNRDSLSAETVFRSLLRQLVVSCKELPKSVLELHQRTESKERPLQLEDLEQALSVACGYFDNIFVVIDALDECDSAQRRALMRALSDVQKKAPFKLFLASRPHLESEIVRAFVAPLRVELVQQTQT